MCQSFLQALPRYAFPVLRNSALNLSFFILLPSLEGPLAELPPVSLQFVSCASMRSACTCEAKLNILQTWGYSASRCEKSRYLPKKLLFQLSQWEDLQRQNHLAQIQNHSTFTSKKIEQDQNFRRAALYVGPGRMLQAGALKNIQTWRSFLESGICMDLSVLEETSTERSLECGASLSRESKQSMQTQLVASEKSSHSIQLISEGQPVSI